VSASLPWADIDTVFLDAGNTLVSMDFHLICEVLGTHGVVCTPDVLARAEAAARPALSQFLSGASTEWSDTFAFYCDAILAGLGDEGAPERAALAPRLASDVRRAAATQRLWSRVLPGVPEALRDLRAAGLTLVVVSNSDGTVEQGMVTAGLRPHLHHVVDSTVVGVEKPDPRIFRHALEAVGARPERTLHVGDLYTVDVLGAWAAGLHALLLDPYGDWAEVDCALAPDVASVARSLLAAR
jgi:putative hydrolase of the HAD superfamily